MNSGLLGVLGTSGFSWPLAPGSRRVATEKDYINAAAASAR